MRSPLGRVAGSVPANPEELDAMRRRAWQEQGFLVIDTADGRLDPAQRAFILSIGECFFGRRLVREKKVDGRSDASKI